MERERAKIAGNLDNQMIAEVDEPSIKNAISLLTDQDIDIGQRLTQEVTHDRYLAEQKLEGVFRNAPKKLYKMGWHEKKKDVIVEKVGEARSEE